MHSLHNYFPAVVDFRFKSMQGAVISKASLSVCLGYRETWRYTARAFTELALKWYCQLSIESVFVLSLRVELESRVELEFAANAA